MTDPRIDRFEARRKHLSKMTDAELKGRFWELCTQAVAPLADLAKAHTSPSIERSVLMRMGIDSITAKEVVARVLEAGLLGKGAGHAVLKVSQLKGTDLRGAAQLIVEKKDVLTGLFQ
jgi:D-ornithine 4,5-aminomutase subunit alpha